MNSFSIVFAFAFLTSYMVTAQSPADKAGADCAQKFPLQPNEKDDLMNGNFDKISPGGKCYVDCFSKAMNFMTPTGTINEPVVTAFYTAASPKITPDQVKATVAKCSSSMTGDGCDKSFNAYKCIQTSLNVKP